MFTCVQAKTCTKQQTTRNECSLEDPGIEKPQSTINFGPNDFSLENGPNWKFSPGAKNLARAVFLMIV